MNKTNKLLQWVAVALCGVIALTGHFMAALVLLSMMAWATSRMQPRLCAVTLSVPEILKDILDALKVETPEVFGPNGCAQDFKSNTAVLCDKVTAHIAHIPTTGAYDPNNGGYKTAAQDVSTVIEDVPVTLNQLRCVPVKISYLMGLATKGVDLYKAAVANVGFALGKYVLDEILSASLTNVSSSFPISPALATLDTFETLRDQCNSQKMFTAGRMAFINTPLANGLGSDDRVRSELFYGQRNGDRGYRAWKNLAGFASVREYTDFPAAAAGLALDRRLAAVSVRSIETVNSIVEELGIPKAMDFVPLTDAESKLTLTGVLWQEQGTGDTYISPAILFGVGVGNQGAGAGAMTDYAGCVIYTQ
jgi:hypothetical protein